MKTRVVLAIIACFLSLLVVSVSCATAPTTAPATTAPPSTKAPPPTTAAGSTTAPAEKPRYGGTLTAILPNDPTNFDSGTKGQGGALTGGLAYQQYMTTDWLRGPAGGGPMDAFVRGTSAIEDLYYPTLAESWKMPAQGVWILQIRKGMKWQKVDSEAGRLMGGREVTADDVAKSLKRLLTAEKSWAAVSQPAMAKATTVEKTGEWEVTIKTPVDYLTSFFWIISGGGFNALYPPEVVEKYGDVADWKNTVGTGPFILTDYTKGSSLTWVKNPDYWETDPVGPGKGNKLPYLDGYRQLIIPDVSSQLAAFRTAKIDALGSTQKEDMQPILKDNPQVVSLRYMAGLGINSAYAIAMRIDKQDLPFKDKRVRQAMMLATDFEGLKKILYGGDAEIDIMPTNKQVEALYQPLSEMPQSVQDLFKYNPEKAKQLLKDAGYADGFKTTVLTQNDPQLIDELSVYKEMWSKVGIDLAIDPRENAAFQTILNARTNDELIYRAYYTTMPVVLYLSPYRGKSSNNPSYINDPPGSVPEIEAINDEVNKYVFTDWPKAYAAYKKLKPHFLENAYAIPRPQPYVYAMWWPWLKNYHGSLTSIIRFSWIDQDLKKSMGR